jgi:2,4-dienoyl-CoA reductase-like NADH-dependent reductase (Old Yellow Enzyme family)
MPETRCGRYDYGRRASRLDRPKADLVLLTRELLRNPYWPLHSARKEKGRGLEPRPRRLGKYLFFLVYLFIS